MTIRTRLTLLFTGVVASLLGVFCGVIYFFAERHRAQEFRERLRTEASNSARLLFGRATISPELFKLLDRNQITVLNREEIIIYDARNQLVYESGTDYLSVDQTTLDQVRLRREVQFRRGDREIVGVLFANGTNRLVVFASGMDKYGFSQQRNLALILSTGWLLATGLVFLAGRFFARKSLQPMTRVISRVDSITASRLELRVDEGNGQDEIAQLARTFNRMLDRLEEAFRLQRAFVSNASHEMRTPLTAITGQIEVALLTEEEPQELRATLQSVLEDVRQLNRLTNGLLTLASISVDETTVSLAPLRVDELLWGVRSDLLKMHPAYTVRVEMDELPEREADLSLPGSETLLKTALFNLMENGCKFSPDHTVQVRLQRLPGYFSVRFHNRGPAIPTEELPLIFKPFHRGSNAYRTPGHGIGLSLTDRIIRLHQGSLRVDSAPDTGTAFTVLLPAQ
jgi:signal transduction histidine kinase